MQQEPNLPPIPKESLDGYKEEAAIPRDIPLPKICFHRDIQVISSTELKCACGVGWFGTSQEIQKLYNYFLTPQK